MYNEYDLAEAFELGYKQASNSYDEYDLAEAYEIGFKEASKFTNDKFNRKMQRALSRDSSNLANSAKRSNVIPKGLEREAIDLSDLSKKLKAGLASGSYETINVGLRD
jgi:hypothetical protein